MTRQERAALRTALADYMASEGCGCCQNRDKHVAAKSHLAILLNVPLYADNYGYNFSQFKTPEKKAH